MKTKAERRLEIVKDAIKQLKIENYLADPGTVVDEYDITCAARLSGIDYDRFSEKDDLKPVLVKIFKNKNRRCRVCARGALLLSTVHKENAFKVVNVSEINGSYDKDSVEDKRLKKLFSEKQLLMMENAFEVENILDTDIDDWNDEDSYYYDNSMHGNFIISEKQVISSAKFGAKYVNPNERLMAILKNMVKNGGIFKP